MDARLAEAFASVIEVWLETADQNQRNADLYQGIVAQIGDMFGIEARTSDDGSVQDSVLALKVPELVEHLTAEVEQLKALALEQAAMLSEANCGCPCCERAEKAETKNQRLKDAAKTIQNLIDGECLDKHAINPHKDSYLNENYHIEITMTVAEARLLKQALEGGE